MACSHEIKPLPIVFGDPFEMPAGSIALAVDADTASFYEPKVVRQEKRVDIYFSADVETDGPIPGPYSMLSFAMVFAGRYDGKNFQRPDRYESTFYRELRPISQQFQREALDVNGLDRQRLWTEGTDPVVAMGDAYEWVRKIAGDAQPVLVAYPLSFDWTWLYWYFIKFSPQGSPFDYSRCFDIKTALAVKSGETIGDSGRSKLPHELQGSHKHTHHAVDDAINQAEIFANIFEWNRNRDANI